jgi:gamma-glutamyltranspeptidase/glutathione hydrolase
MRRFFICGWILMLAASAVPGADRLEGEMFATRSIVYGENGMVAAAHPMAAQIGVDVLKNGGNAIDAAIAVNAALGFLEPTANGIGGDLFAIVWHEKSQKLYGLNGSGRSPLALTADKVEPTDRGWIPLYNPYSWTVPGTVDGWFALHGKFGNMPMKDVLAPAIRAAEEGRPVPQVIANAWNRSARIFGDKPGFASTFLPNGKAPQEGEVFRNPDLAKSLRLIAEQGRDAFYEGAIAEAVVAFSDANGGFFTMEDFRKHRSDWIEPQGTNYRGVTLYELPPNGQGIAALQMLNILEGFDLAAMGRDSVDFWHVMVEAKKLAYEDRAKFYSDLDFMEVPVEGLISKEYGQERAKLIDMNRSARRITAGNPRLHHGDTTYLTTADKDGNMVSLIQSNYTGFGSGYVVEGWGFGLQDRGGLFNLDPESPNYLEPGKRPFHTIIPAFAMKDGKPWISFGVMGGDMQPQGHVQIIVNMVDFGMNLQEAGDAARYYHTGSSDPRGSTMSDGGTLYIEAGVSDQLRRELTRRGHTLGVTIVPYGGYQAVLRNHETGVYAGATESRKDGCALGY